MLTSFLSFKSLKFISPNISLSFLKQKVFFFTQFRTDIARTEYLSNADERLRWQANSLPADDLCTENAIMLKRFNRYLRERKTL